MEAFVAKGNGHEQLLHGISEAVEKLSGRAEVSSLQAVGTEGTGEVGQALSQGTVMELKKSVEGFLSQLKELQDSEGLLSLVGTIKQNRSEQDNLLREVAQGTSLYI